MHPDAIVYPFGERFTGRGVGGDHQSFVAGSAQMLEHSDDKIADTVNLRQK